MTPTPLFLKAIAFTTCFSVTGYGLIVSSNAKDNPTFMVGVLMVCLGMIVFGLMADLIKSERSAT